MMLYASGECFADALRRDEKIAVLIYGGVPESADHFPANDRARDRRRCNIEPFAIMMNVDARSLRIINKRVIRTNLQLLIFNISRHGIAIRIDRTLSFSAY